MDELLDQDVREWYIEEFPDDDLGYDLYEGLTFDEMRQVLRNGEDFYDWCGCGDSVIRERLFAELADILEVDYDDIYETWLHPNRGRI